MLLLFTNVAGTWRTINGKWITTIDSMPFPKYTRCPKKVVHQTHGDNLSILNGFSKFFHCWKRRKISNKSHIILPTIPSVCCRTTLRN